MSIPPLFNSFVRKTRHLIFCGVVILVALIQSGSTHAQEWNGTFSVCPFGAPEMALEAVGTGTIDGTRVSLGASSGAANHKWTIISKGDSSYVIKPSYSSNFVLTTVGGATENGASIVLERENGKSSQLWSIRRSANGSFNLLLKQAPEKGLDDYQGNTTAGARLDLWPCSPNDGHLQWAIKQLDGAMNPIFDKPGQNITTQHASDIPVGVTKDFTFSASTIFPGTTRTGTIFIPAQYDGSKPACVYVRQDGYNQNEKAMLEALIAAKEMPVTIGVFVRPGNLPSPINGMAPRRNRCFEYDSVGDNYVRFITEEILPYVEKTFNLKLSKSGNDRCIAGISSGGISAFNAAWERPDTFSRVYANSGSFVAFRGGHEFPTLIRKFEPKPIRCYFTTATHDMENCAGDWFLLDQEMDKALKFSGYDYSFHVVEGGHGGGWIENFSDAMRFIWKGWPEPVHAGKGAPRVRDVLLENQRWELVAKDYGDARGPACNSKGEVFFVDTKANKIYKIGLDGKIEVFLADAAHSNGLSVGAKDEIYTVSSSTGNVMCYDAQGNGKLYASGVDGFYVLARPEGGVYISDASAKSTEGSKIWLVQEGGQKVAMESDIKHATGLAMRPDHWLLSVADGHSKWVHSYQVQRGGGLINKERFFWLHVPDWEDDAGAESVCYAKEGQMLVATRLGIQICADDGPTQVILPMPDRSRPIGICIGGAEFNTLFAFCGDKIWKRVVKIHTSGAFSPALNVGATPL